MLIFIAFINFLTQQITVISNDDKLSLVMTFVQKKRMNKINFFIHNIKDDESSLIKKLFSVFANGYKE